MKHSFIVLIICLILCLSGVASCEFVNARDNDNNKLERIIDERSLYVYKFDVKDHNNVTHEIIVCKTTLNDGGVSMLEINKY